VHADPAGDLAGLPAPVPDDVPGPADAAEGPAVGAQQPRRERAQRARWLVATAAGPAHRERGRHAAGPGLDQRGLRGRDPVGASPGAGPGHGGGVRGRARSGGRAARRGTHGGYPHRQDRGVRPHRPAGLPAGGRGRRRAGRGRLQDRPAPAHRGRRAQLDGAGHLRAGGRACAAAAVPPGGAAPPADRRDHRLVAYRGVTGPAPGPGAGHRRRAGRGRRAVAQRVVSAGS
jgi:hypothetical protein